MFMATIRLFVLLTTETSGRTLEDRERKLAWILLRGLFQCFLGLFLVVYKEARPTSVRYSDIFTRKPCRGVGQGLGVLVIRSWL